jgi:hypothetical protein
VTGLGLVDSGQDLTAKLVAQGLQLVLPFHGKFHSIAPFYAAPRRGWCDFEIIYSSSHYIFDF